MSGPRGWPSQSGWACTRARPLQAMVGTRASPSTGPPGSVPPVTVARSSCPRRRTLCSRTRRRTSSPPARSRRAAAQGSRSTRAALPGHGRRAAHVVPTDSRRGARRSRREDVCGDSPPAPLGDRCRSRTRHRRCCPRGARAPGWLERRPLGAVQANHVGLIDPARTRSSAKCRSASSPARSPSATARFGSATSRTGT